MDNEIVNVIIAVAVIYFVVKWATGGSANDNPTSANNLARTLGFRPKNATPEMIASVQSAFPDIPRENIHYDLLRTGSVEITVNRLLERGYLDAPPPAYTRAFPPSPSISTTTTQPSSTSQPKAESKPKSLIERFHLESQAAAQKPISQQKEEEWDGKGPIPLSAKGKGRAEPLRFDDGSAQGIIDAGGRSVEGRIGVGRPIYEGGTTGIGKPTTNPKPGGGVWEATPEKRMEALRRKKEEMILAARKRLLEKEATEKA